MFSTQKLTGLFDYQRFAQNQRLSEIISDSEERLSPAARPLEDSEVDIWAAGDIESMTKLDISESHSKKNDE